MKFKLVISILSVLLIIGIYSFKLQEEPEIRWYTFEEGLSLAKKEQKKVFIDIYTDWCGWCKKMDRTTFQDEEVVNFLNNNYVSIRLNAETRDTIHYMSNDYHYIADDRNGYNQIAPALLDNKLSFPSFVILDSKGKRTHKSSGYLSKEQLITKLKMFK